jgi:hypothetical protein
VSRGSRSYAFYGRSGTGKTTLAGSFPGPVYLVDIDDDGWDSVSDVKDLEVTEPKTWEALEEVYWWLKAGDHDFKTVVLDTITNMQTLAIRKVLQDKKKSTERAGDWGTMTKREWGDVAQLMKSWISNWRDLDMEVVFIAQDRLFNFGGDEEEVDAELAPEVGPRLSPSVASALNAAVSVIGNTFIRETEYTKEVAGKKKQLTRIEYCLRVGPNPVYITKMRKPIGIKLPPVIIDPTYEELIDIIEGVE